MAPAVRLFCFLSSPAPGNQVSGNFVLTFGSDGALVADSGHVPGVTKRMIADITRFSNRGRCVFSSTPTGIPTTSRGQSLSRPAGRRRHLVSTPGTQFEPTRPESLYNDLTEMSKYMPQLKQALASGRGAGLLDFP